MIDFGECICKEALGKHVQLSIVDQRTDEREDL